MNRDHGGGLDAAIGRYGGARGDWLDLSTGINPVPYPVGDLPAEAWTALPDRAASERLCAAARRFWKVPDAADILAAPGASSLIARMPWLTTAPEISIPFPTYNEHEAAFATAGRRVTRDRRAAAHVFVHPDNPTGRLWARHEMGPVEFTLIDESFCDTVPGQSHVGLTAGTGHVVLKSFGKFWGLAGLRLGFLIAHPDHVARMRDLLGPWPVAGPALEIATAALRDHDWAAATRTRLSAAATRLDAVMAGHARLAGGTDLFRLFEVDDAGRWQERLARHHIWSRIFPYSNSWLRLGLPPDDGWERLQAALG